MSQNMIALKRQLMQSKLSVLMPRKWGGGTGGRNFTGGRPPWPPIEPPLLVVEERKNGDRL